MTFALCILGGVLAVAGDVAFKRWAANDSLSMLAVGIVLYATDACVWAAILKRGTALSAGAVIWSATGLLLAIVAGRFLYGEQLTPRQIVSAALVLVGLLLA